MDRAYSSGFDAHTHLDFPAFDGDRDAVCARARAAGVNGWVVAGADPRQWDRVEDIASRTGGTAVLGLHPWFAAEASEEAQDLALDDLARRAVRGVGECGLDWYRTRDTAGRQRQRRAFRAQLALARERDLPVVVHCVRAYGVLLEICERDGVPSAGGMIHAWTGAPELVPRALRLGLHLSFGPVVFVARRARAAVAEVPDARLLVETDCPDQAPPGHGRGEPADLVPVAAEVARLRGTEPEAVLASTAANARRLLGLPIKMVSAPGAP